MASLMTGFEQDYANRFHGVELQHGIDFSDTSLPYDNDMQALSTAEHVGSLRSELFAEIANDTEGLDLEAIDSYFSAVGLPRRDFIVMNPNDLPNYNRIVAKYGWAAYPHSDDGSAFYGTCPASTDLAVVLRDKEAEAIYGTAFTETTLVHELAHASSNWNEWTINKYPEGRTLTARRIGQAVINIGSDSSSPNSGDYLEEAFAATVQSNYLKSCGKELGYQYYADIAAEGLAYLCAKSPEIFPAMVDARKSVEGLRRVAQSINSIHPGLYSRLQKVAYTEQDFAQATQNIQELVESEKRII